MRLVQGVVRAPGAAHRPGFRPAARAARTRGRLGRLPGPPGRPASDADLRRREARRPRLGDGGGRIREGGLQPRLRHRSTVAPRRGGDPRRGGRAAGGAGPRHGRRGGSRALPRGRARGVPARRRAPADPGRSRRRGGALQRAARVARGWTEIPPGFARALLLQLARRSLSGLPRLRPGHRPRLEEDHPRPDADAGRRRHRAVPGDRLRREPARPRQGVPQGGHPDGRALEETAGRAASAHRGRRPHVRPRRMGKQVVRHPRLLPLARVEHLQDARPRVPVALARLRGMPDLPRSALPRGVALLALAGTDVARALRPARDRTTRAARAARAQGFAPPGRPRARGDPRATRLPRSRRPRLPRARPALPDALRRRGAARQPHLVPGGLPGGHGLRARRAERRHARARPRAHGRHPPQSGRTRQHGRGRRARRVRHARRRLADRDRATPRRRGRPPHLPGAAEGYPEGQGLRHGRLAVGSARAGRPSPPARSATRLRVSASPARRSTTSATSPVRFRSAAWSASAASRARASPRCSIRSSVGAIRNPATRPRHRSG